MGKQSITARAKQAALMMKAYTPKELFNEDDIHCRRFENIFENTGAGQVIDLLKQMAESDNLLKAQLYSGGYISF